MAKCAQICSNMPKYVQICPNICPYRHRVKSRGNLFNHFNATIRINRHLDLGTKGRLRRLNQPFSPNLDEKDGLSNFGRCSIVKGRLRWTGSCTPPHSLPKNDANAAFSMRFDDGLGRGSIFVFTFSNAETRRQMNA